MSAAKLTERDLDEAIRRSQTIAEPMPPNVPQPTEPLQEYDVERSLPWFPLACVLAVVAGAFIPHLLSGA